MKQKRDVVWKDHVAPDHPAFRILRIPQIWLGRPNLRCRSARPMRCSGSSKLRPLGKFRSLYVSCVDYRSPTLLNGLAVHASTSYREPEGSSIHNPFDFIE